MLPAEVGGERPAVKPPRRAGQGQQREVWPAQHVRRQLRGDRWGYDRALTVAGEQDRAAGNREFVLVSQLPLAGQGLAGGVGAQEQQDPVERLRGSRARRSTAGRTGARPAARTSPHPTQRRWSCAVRDRSSRRAAARPAMRPALR